MIEPIWQAIGPHINVERMRAEVAEFFAYSRLSSFDAIKALARLIADRMKQAGMEDVRLIEFPADGRTFYGGWAMPRAYDVQSARLADTGSGDVLADYTANPTNLMLYSLPTPPEGI